ncbi:hypothetical protein ACT5QL_005348 [Escherichia coli]|nr:hypothetical protein [Escherichia coli]MCX8445824.1 hypothetical protein [Escherichia coli]
MCAHTLNLRLVAGRWSLVAGRWSLVAGRWSLVAGVVMVVFLLPRKF